MQYKSNYHYNVMYAYHVVMVVSVSSVAHSESALCINNGGGGGGVHFYLGLGAIPSLHTEINLMQYVVNTKHFLYYRSRLKTYAHTQCVIECVCVCVCVCACSCVLFFSGLCHVQFLSVTTVYHIVYHIVLYIGITTDNTLIIWVAIGGMLISILVIIFAVLLVTIVIMKRRLFTKYETFE